jgi:hypothetical protein
VFFACLLFYLYAGAVVFLAEWKDIQIVRDATSRVIIFAFFLILWPLYPLVRILFR